MAGDQTRRAARCPRFARPGRPGRMGSNSTREGVGMSVIMTLLINGDPAALEQHAASNPIRPIVDRAVEHGLIAHRFYGSEDGRVLVVDEWPDPESFGAFFEEMRSE